MQRNDARNLSRRAPTNSSGASDFSSRSLPGLRPANFFLCETASVGPSCHTLPPPPLREERSLLLYCRTCKEFAGPRCGKFLGPANVRDQPPLFAVGCGLWLLPFQLFLAERVGSTSFTCRWQVSRLCRGEQVGTALDSDDLIQALDDLRNFLGRSATELCSDALGGKSADLADFEP